MAGRSMNKMKTFFLIGLVLLFAITIGPGVSVAAEWSLFTDAEQKIQFLSIGSPEKSQLQDDLTETITWQFGYSEDGTSGYVDAARLKEGSFAGLDVAKESADLRAGIEAGGRTKVTYELVTGVSGVPAVEFTTQTTTSSGNAWYGIVRMLVLDDTLYTLGISAPSLAQIQTEETLAFLNSLKRTE